MTTTVNDRLVIEEMTADDLKAVHAIESASFKDPWSLHSFQNEVETNDLSLYLVARLGGKVVAYIGSWIVLEEAHITTLAVDRKCRRRGIAYDLVSALAGEAAGRGVRCLTLEVRPSNVAARNFYEKLGFETLGRRRFYYSDEDALVMTRQGLDLPPYFCRAAGPEGKKQVLILGLETSCDDTAAAVVADGRQIQSSLVSSQVELHARFGGVVPEIASRRHLVLVNTLIDRALNEAGITLGDLDAVAVSHGPGLVGALLVGVSTAKALAYACRLPLVAVNHLEAHLYANYLDPEPIAYPAVNLVVSGGHTELFLLERPGSIRSLGRTRDDAAGEAFDKVARVLDLGYPGGPLIDNLSRRGDPAAIKFPRALLKSGARSSSPAEETYDFSFSGLKTAVINYLHRCKSKNEPFHVPDVVASFQEALVDVLVKKTVRAARSFRAETVLLSGGVAANSHLRRRMQETLALEMPETALRVPPPDLCTDNAAMIAAAAYPRYLDRQFASLDLNARPGLNITPTWSTST